MNCIVDVSISVQTGKRNYAVCEQWTLIKIIINLLIMIITGIGAKQWLGRNKGDSKEYKNSRYKQQTVILRLRLRAQEKKDPLHTHTPP